MKKLKTGLAFMLAFQMTCGQGITLAWDVSPVSTPSSPTISTSPEGFIKPNQTTYEAVVNPDKEPATPGEIITLNNGVVLTGQDEGSYIDEDGNKWIGVTKDGDTSYIQLGFSAGYTAELKDNTKLTSKTAFVLNEDLSFPDGIDFIDQAGNRWVTKDNSFQPIDFSAGTKIELSNGTQLTAQVKFSYNPNGTMPDGISFIDQAGNRWVTKNQGFQQIDVSAGSKIQLSNGTQLTATVKFNYNPDGTMPDGINFIDQNGNYWVSANQHFSYIGPAVLLGSGAATIWIGVSSDEGYSLSRIFGAVPAKKTYAPESTERTAVLMYFDGSGRYIGKCISTITPGNENQSYFFDAYGQQIQLVMAPDPVHGGSAPVAATVPVIPSTLTPLGIGSTYSWIAIDSDQGYSLSRIFGAVPAKKTYAPESTERTAVLEYFDGSGRYIGKSVSTIGLEGKNYFYNASGQEIQLVMAPDPVHGGTAPVAAGVVAPSTQPTTQPVTQPSNSSFLTAGTQMLAQVSAMDNVATKLAALKYDSTADSVYTDLGSIKARQAELFVAPSDCLDRSVYLFNIAKELNLNPTIYILNNVLTGQGHAVVEIDDGAAGRKVYDLTSDGTACSLYDYTAKGYTVTAAVNSLEGLTAAVKNIHGAFDISTDGEDYSAYDYSGDDAYGAMCADSTSSDAPSVGSVDGNDIYGGNAGETVGAAGSDGVSYGDYLDARGSVPYVLSQNGQRIYATNLGRQQEAAMALATVNNFYTALVQSATNLATALTTGNFAALPQATFQAVRTAQEIMKVDTELNTAYHQALNQYIEAQQTNAPYNERAAAQQQVEIASHNLDTFRNTLNAYKSGTDSIHYQEVTPAIEVIGNQITVTESWIDKSGESHKEITATGTINPDRSYTITGQFNSAGPVWNDNVKNSIIETRSDFGHELITSPNGTQTDIDLSDGSFLMYHGTAQIGSGSANALDIIYPSAKAVQLPGDNRAEVGIASNLQVYWNMMTSWQYDLSLSELLQIGSRDNIPAKDILTLGRDGVPQIAKNVMAEFFWTNPMVDPATWTPEGTKDGAALYRNVYSGEILGVKDNGNGWFAFTDLNGKETAQFNVNAPVSVPIS